jgi:hypothetical protein
MACCWKSKRGVACGLPREAKAHRHENDHRHQETRTCHTYIWINPDPEAHMTYAKALMEQRDQWRERYFSEVGAHQEDKAKIRRVEGVYEFYRITSMGGRATTRHSTVASRIKAALSPETARK